MPEYACQKSDLWLTVAEGHREDRLGHRSGHLSETVG